MCIGVFDKFYFTRNKKVSDRVSGFLTDAVFNTKLDETTDILFILESDLWIRTLKTLCTQMMYQADKKILRAFQPQLLFFIFEKFYFIWKQRHIDHGD